ncbi:hypothetical protein [Hyalangium minutum]|uniref:Uncharacterized protein n=1 Tax=Hyalangium minutum TaxID=394096 RepID=A0A085WX77_9BACT|nr:hypothetical protein [Hyalangium minutum]KFE72290.1 hypothetical protein DB31_0552 [Hyalangium minutum]
MLSALLVLAVAAAPAKASAPPPEDPLQWQVPGQVSVVEVPAKMDVGGIPVRFRVVTSKEKVEFLLRHFGQAFADAGFYIERKQQRLAPQPHLTALNTRTLTSYTVILTPQAGGLTEVVVGEARLGARRPTAPPSVPVYPGAKNLLQADFEGAQTLGYEVQAPAAEVKAWYQEQLSRAGYRAEEPFVFRKKAQEVRVEVTPHAGSLHVLLFLRTAGEAPSK